jgi:hypothetical protein
MIRGKLQATLEFLEGSIETQRPDDRLALRVADAKRPRRRLASLDERSD